LPADQLLFEVEKSGKNDRHHKANKVNNPQGKSVQCVGANHPVNHLTVFSFESLLKGQWHNPNGMVYL